MIKPSKKDTSFYESSRNTSDESLRATSKAELAFEAAIKTSWNLYLIKFTLIYSVLVNEIGKTIFIQLLLT